VAFETRISTRGSVYGAPAFSPAQYLLTAFSIGAPRFRRAHRFRIVLEVSFVANISPVNLELLEISLPAKPLEALMRWIETRENVGTLSG
jgi:hypothetical protein